MPLEKGNTHYKWKWPGITLCVLIRQFKSTIHKDKSFIKTNTYMLKMLTKKRLKASVNNAKLLNLKKSEEANWFFKRSILKQMVEANTCDWEIFESYIRKCQKLSLKYILKYIFWIVFSSLVIALFFLNFFIYMKLLTWTGIRHA